MPVTWTTIIAIAALAGLLGYGFWCASKAIKEAIDDIWRYLGY